VLLPGSWSRAQQPPTPPATPKAATPPAFLSSTPGWSKELDAPLAASPAFDAERLYAPLSNGRLVALALTSGEVQWSVEAATTLAPAALERRVFVGGDQALLALDGADGRTLWTLPVTSACARTPFAAGGWIVAASVDDTVNLVRANDGHRAWTRGYGAPLSGNPAVANDRLYVPLEDGRILAVDMTTGDPAWEAKLGGAPTGIEADGERLYVGSRDDNLYCLSARDGRERWRWPCGGDVVGTPLVDRTRVYFAALDNMLRALNKNSGKQQWRCPLPLRPASGPIPVGDVLVASGLSTRLFACARGDGKAAGEYSGGETALLLGPPYLAPAVPSVDATGATMTTPLLVFVTAEGLVQTLHLPQQRNEKVVRATR
jgi:outer membrane protein assembly factor BamB